MNDIEDLRKLDCNCNDCILMIRDNIKLKAHRLSYEGTGHSDNLQFGLCILNNKQVTFSPNTCQLDTQDCFRYRKEYKLGAVKR